MLLHLFDDEKVVNRAIENFEKVFPGGNIFICFINGKPQIVKHHSNLYYYHPGTTFNKSILEKGISKVIIHYLTNSKIEFIQTYIPTSIPCYWIIWGGDLYNAILANRGYPLYYEPRYLGKDYYKSLLKCFLHKIGLHTKKEIKLLNFIKDRITYYITDTDFEIAKKYIGKYINGKQITGYSYYPLDTILGDLKNCKACGNLIWIGNSASFTNNHLYAFRFLSRLNIGKRNIIVPLSYGGSSKYITHIKNKGHNIWKNSFESLDTFLPLEKYYALMKSSEICIFSSWRQEAFGNIVVALYLGAKVYLSKKSTLLEHFKKMGVKIFTLEEINQESLDVPLSEEIINSNKGILYKLLNEQCVLENIKQIFK